MNEEKKTLTIFKANGELQEQYLLKEEGRNRKRESASCPSQISVRPRSRST